MVIDRETITKQALTLPVDQRIAIAHELLESAEPAPSADWEAAWEEEIARRIARYEAGETKAISAAEFFKKLDEIVPG
jgi:putative addiction module component (TIGR02574 family)